MISLDPDEENLELMVWLKLFKTSIVPIGDDNVTPEINDKNSKHHNYSWYTIQEV